MTSYRFFVFVLFVCCAAETQHCFEDHLEEWMCSCSASQWGLL